MNRSVPILSALTPAWAIHSFPAEAHESGDPGRFQIAAPVGLWVVAITARPDHPMMVICLAPVGARAETHAFWWVGADQLVEPTLGRSLGDVHPVVLLNKGGSHSLMFAIEDRPWPDPKGDLRARRAEAAAAV